MAQITSQPQTTSLSALRKPDAISAPAEMRAGFDTVGGFELMQRGARLLASSTIVPAQYRNQIEKKDSNGGTHVQDNPAGMSNCVVALNMAQRMGADPLMIMQNLYIVEGRPAWSAQYIIASINACGKYSPLRFRIEDLGEQDAEYTEIVRWENRKPIKETRNVKIRNQKCIAWALEKATGEVLESPPVTVELAVKEGWYGKNGSKWQTMPEVMLRYRAASFFGKLYAPELLMGIQTAEEVQDTTFTYEPDESGVYQMTTAEIRKTEVNPETGEVYDETEQQIPPAAPKQPAIANTAPASAGEKKGKTAPKPADKSSAAPSTAPAKEPPFEPEPAEPGEDPFPAGMTVLCPKNEKQVDEINCAACASRDGCPTWE